jgi:acetyltransferase-like isoleucine patch superfamily enzyme
MPVNRHHAFGEGTTLPPPERLAEDHQHRSLAAEIWKHFRTECIISDDALLGSSAWCINRTGDKTGIKIGAKTVIRGLLRVEQEGRISIGDFCYVGDDVVVASLSGVEIGSNVLIAHGCQIFDNASHPLDFRQRAQQYSDILSGREYQGKISKAPIIIHDNSWLGLNSIIMKGVDIGARSIVAAGSVVLDNVPPDTIVGGNPAQPRSKPNAPTHGSFFLRFGRR